MCLCLLVKWKSLISGVWQDWAWRNERCEGGCCCSTSWPRLLQVGMEKIIFSWSLLISRCWCWCGFLGLSDVVGSKVLLVVSWSGWFRKWMMLNGAHYLSWLFHDYYQKHAWNNMLIIWWVIFRIFKSRSYKKARSLTLKGNAKINLKKSNFHATVIKWGLYIFKI